MLFVKIVKMSQHEIQNLNMEQIINEIQMNASHIKIAHSMRILNKKARRINENQNS